MISLELCEISFVFREIKTTTAKKNDQRALSHKNILPVRLKRAEGPKAPSPEHRPGYNSNQQDAL